MPLNLELSCVYNEVDLEQVKHRVRDKKERFCSECDFKGNSEQAMKKHAISHLETAVNCETCGKLCGNRNGLTLHMRKLHKEDEEKTHNDSSLLQVLWWFRVPETLLQANRLSDEHISLFALGMKK